MCNCRRRRPQDVPTSKAVRTPAAAPHAIAECLSLAVRHETCSRTAPGAPHAEGVPGSWIMSLCGSPVCVKQAVVVCALKEFFDSSTCMNHLLVIGINMLLVIILALHLVVRVLKSGSLQQLVMLNSPLHFAAILFHGCLGLAYLGLGLWMMGSSFDHDASLYLPHWWLVNLSQGISLILISFAFSIQARVLGVRNDGSERFENALYKPLNTETVADKDDSGIHVTPFAKAGVFSLMSFWWLNPLIKVGYEKPLEEKDMPLLGATDRAYNQYLIFLEQLNSKRQSPNSNQSVFWSPLILKAFINVSLGKGTFKYEGYALAAAMFVCKCCESLSQRQWYFRTRRIGLQVRSCLSAAIYKKQQNLSSSAKMKHSSGQIMNYVTVDAYRIGEFPYNFHQTWTTIVQLCMALVILYNAVGLAMIASLFVIIITVLGNAPLAKLQHKFQRKLMEAQDVRLKAMSESLIHMKVLKLYAWETHFKKRIEVLREDEYKWLLAFQLRRAYNSFLFWSSPVLVSAATFLTCYIMKVPLDASNVFTFVATLRLVQTPIRQIPDIIGTVIQAKVAFTRIVKFLDAPELTEQVRKKYHVETEYPIVINTCSFSWDENPSKTALKNINLVVRTGEKVAICGEVGSGKSTLLAAALGEISKTEGTLRSLVANFFPKNRCAGTVQDNILFGSSMDEKRYQETLLKCSLVKDLQNLPYGDCTQIGERGVNLSGGQKQRVQLARALYQNADIYLLDDPFSAVDAHTATNLFNEYVMGALSDKTVLLVTHQVDFLPVFDCILLMSDGEIIRCAPYQDLLAHCQEFQNLVNAHKDIIGISDTNDIGSHRAMEITTEEKTEIRGSRSRKHVKPPPADQLIKQEEREMGDTGAQISQNSWMAANVQNPNVSSDLSIVDLDVPFAFVFSISASLNAYSNLGVLSVVTWQVLFVCVPMICLAIKLQRYYLTSAKELMRINGTTKSALANHLGESILGAVTIRAFNGEDRFFAESLELVDKNAGPYFYNFAATEWLIQRLETMIAVVLSFSAFIMALLPAGTFSPGFVGMALSYGLSLNVSFVSSIQKQCTLANQIISVERVNQYMDIQSEAAEVIEEKRPAPDWPQVGTVELRDLKIRYRKDSPLVLHGITCTFEGGDKIGIVGRTGSGKTTLIGALFRLVEPAGGKIIIDSIDITTIGLHDLRSRLGIIPQDPTLFQGTVRYNLDPLGQFSDKREVLDKCQLLEAVQEKENGLDSIGR
ncbi:hypothetical protein PR202_gb24485 [Eleusine coracana subsp. coracana]|uniref:ABC transporter C family member 10 n=1 Tax=Eleusine coracana subsp. coracana TaxID=191504 RepID=A0AAV5FL57_ELECO|nr:hypothetical protein PR202_gb24485 [Eleusine coracana subsp. coracana]